VQNCKREIIRNGVEEVGALAEFSSKNLPV
jgi:hypothetical protein